MGTQSNIKQQTATKKESKATKPILFSLSIGLYAGLIWGVVRWLATGLNFTKVSQAFLLDPFVERKVLGGLLWQIAGLAAFIIMSVLAALFYMLVLSRLKGPWPGLLMGLAWWLLGYIGAGPLVGAVPPLNQIGWNSIVTDFCFFVMWGLFIGYSISFEFHDESDREPKGNPKASIQNG